MQTAPDIKAVPSFADMFVSHPISVEARLGDFVNFTCDISIDTGLHRTFRHYMANGAFLELNDIRDRNDM